MLMFAYRLSATFTVPKTQAGTRLTTFALIGVTEQAGKTDQPLLTKWDLYVLPLFHENFYFVRLTKTNNAALSFY